MADIVCDIFRHDLYNGNAFLYEDRSSCQIFTASQSYVATKGEFRMSKTYHEEGASGYWHFTLRETNEVGTVLAEGDLDCDDVPLGVGGWYGAQFASPVLLTAGNVYALRIDAVWSGRTIRTALLFRTDNQYLAGVGRWEWLPKYPYQDLPSEGDYGFRIWGYVLVAPTVTTNPAVVDATLAELNGTLGDDGGEACDCGFEWGETIAYGNITPTQSRTSGQTFSQVIEGLSHTTTYHFKAFATNLAGTSYGADVTLTTAAESPGIVAPSVDTIGATGITFWAANLLGELTDDGGEACDVRFQWGETVAYGNDTAWQSGKHTLDTFQQAISGLDPNTTYHFRAQAKNNAGIANGADRTFTTSHWKGSPIVDQLIYQHAERMER